MGLLRLSLRRLAFSTSRSKSQFVLLRSVINSGDCLSANISVTKFFNSNEPFVVIQRPPHRFFRSSRGCGDKRLDGRPSFIQRKVVQFHLTIYDIGVTQSTRPDQVLGTDTILIGQYQARSSRSVARGCGCFGSGRKVHRT